MTQESKTLPVEDNACCDDSCCNDTSSGHVHEQTKSYDNVVAVKTSDPNKLTEAVHSRYSDIAQQLLVKSDPKSEARAACCAPDEIALENVKDTIKQNVSIPSLGSDKQLLKYADPKSGETVIDFGSGPGKDLLNIANDLKDEGKFIGVDFSEKMIEVAEKNTRELGLRNVNFVQSSLDDINLEDNIGDLIISNCVINLVSNKNKTFKEAYRILRKGGRIVFSDYVLDQELDEGNVSVKSYCGCFGNNTREYYVQGLKSAGFKDIETIVEYTVQQPMGTQTVTYYSTIFIGYK